MNVLADDIGVGTQDILFSLEETDENSPRMVLPSPTRQKSEEIEKTSGDLFIRGSTMGGGPVSSAIERRAQRSSVVMTPRAARTVRDDLSEVEEKGIEIAKEGPKGASEIVLRDLDFPALELLLDETSASCDCLAVAVQDHGDAPQGVSDRRFRVSRMAEFIESGGELSEFAFLEAPEDFHRFSAVLKDGRQLSENVVVADTKISAMMGAYSGSPSLIVDAGNGHVSGALFSEHARITAFFEHHIASVDSDHLTDILKSFLSGELSNDRIFEEGGHGAYIGKTLEPEDFLTTGPRRAMVMRSDLPFRSPPNLEDVMMAGPYGLVRLTEELFEDVEVD